MKKPKAFKKNIKERMKEQKKYYSKEDVFLSRMASITRIPKGTVASMFKERAVTTIRFNTLKDNAENIYKRVRSQGIFLVEVPWISNTYIIPNNDKSELGKLPEYNEGLFYIQNLSSMLPPLILNPKEKDKVLDMCAAPGSKTLLLADMMRNKGKIVANDVDAWRIGKLKEIITMFGIKNCEVTSEDGTGFGKREAERFDRILLDAPCSGEGMIYLASPAALRFWNIKKVKAEVNIQKNLIISAFNALKKGGTLIYSTCTIEPDENEGVITFLLSKFNNAKIEEIPLFDSQEFNNFKKHIKRGLLSWNGKIYNKEVSKTYRVLPSGEMMGFYIAKIVKA